MNHEPDDEAITATTVMTQMLTILENDPSQPTRRAFAVVAREEHEDEVLAFHTVRDGAYDVKNNRRLPSGATVCESQSMASQWCSP